MRLSGVAYKILVTTRGPRIARRLRSCAPVFCFHNVVAPDDTGHGDAPLHLGLPDFEGIVEWLRSHYEVVTLRELVTRAGSRAKLDGLAAITFDDAYRGVFQHALPVLARFGIPCTVFVVTDFAERPSPTWWDVMATRGLLTEAGRERALWTDQGLTGKILDRESGAPEMVIRDSYLPATWQRLLSALGDAVAIGSHTVRHANLGALAGPELGSELGRSRELIHERTGCLPDAVSYPYGLWTDEVLSAAARAGYAMGFTLGDRPGRAGDDALAFPRINVPAGISLDALECWAAGLRPRRPR